MRLYVDDELRLDTDKGDSEVQSKEWVERSPYCLAFGNELNTRPNVFLREITPAVTGYSIWRQVRVIINEPQGRREVLSWSAKKDGFPDQYQLDHIIEVDASVNEHDQGYSGWTQLPDGRIFVVHYTDDTAEAARPNPHQFGIPWIRGTFVDLSDLPPVKQPKQK